MTSSQPPQPPMGGQPPEPGQQPPPGYAPPPPSGPPPSGPPPSGPPPAGPPPGYAQQPPPGYAQQPPPGYGQQPPPGYGQQPPPGYGRPPQQPGQNPFAQPQGAGAGVSFDAKKLTMAAYVIGGLTILYLVLSFFTWYDLGNEQFLGVDFNVSGWAGSGSVKTAFFLFLLATVWAVLPAFTDLKLGFPRSWVTVGLAALGFILTLIAWIDTFKWNFSIWALLGMLTATAILLFSVLTLIPELRNRPALPGGLANAAQWANQPAPGPQAGQPRPYGQPAPPYGQPTQQQQYAPPPPPPGPTGPPSYGPPPGGPSAPPPPPPPGGSTASGEGPTEGPLGS